jgi:catechol 2,3-dioxygenase-like lactoylglutathione lyase family enzyme
VTHAADPPGRETLELSRGKFDVGLLTNQGSRMLDFWRDELGLPVERTLHPVPGVTQHKLTLKGAVLKLNCVDAPLPSRAAMSGLRTLLIAEPAVQAVEHLRDPDGNLVCLVPQGWRGYETFGVHFGVSDETAFQDFFGRVLGLPAVGDRSYDLGGAVVSFSWSPDVVPGAGGSSVGYGYLTLQVMDVVKAHALVCGRGATEERPPSSAHTTTDSTISFILDPDGNRIEISQRPDLLAAAQRTSQAES